ncbi:EAL domain-containing response regulator [Pseudomonas sp. TH03]|nr:EAL domain-containing response regulator [Pseudomonas sp. TH03]
MHRMIAVEQLRAMDCTQVYVARDGASALALLRTLGAVDVIICDMNMEGMDGLEFLRHVDESHLACGVILFNLMAADLRWSVQQLLALSGLKILGDLGQPMKLQSFAILLRQYIELRDGYIASDSTATNLPSLEMIQEGLCENMFKPFYQPKFNLSNFVPCGAEVLARWDHPVLGVLMPADFLPLIAKYDLLDELFAQIFEQGVAFQAHLLLRGYRLQLSYNLDAQQLLSLELAGRIKDILYRYALPATLVTFELLETGLIGDSRASMENMIRLRMMGCGLAIDDFGTGYSSLQRLCDFPFNQIKLDMHFISNMDLPVYRAAITSTLAMAKALNMTMIVEGVESDMQRRQLVQLGCTLGQGYWYAKPMAHLAMIQWLNEADTGCIKHF